MVEANEQSDAVHEPAPLRLRVAAPAIDRLIGMSASAIISLRSTARGFAHAGPELAEGPRLGIYGCARFGMTEAGA